MSKQPFHFSLGPVQGFISQSRRTRDLWSGSYLLSYLSGITIKTIIDNGGEIEFPNINKDALFLAITDDTKRPKDKDDIAARVGSLPNRFKACAKNPDVVAKKADNEIIKVWGIIAINALEKFKKQGNANYPHIVKVWERQVKNLWEIMWIIGNEGYLLDMRKNLRAHIPSEEPGEKCTQCGEREALSPKENYPRTELKEWWKELLNNLMVKKDFIFQKKGMKDSVQSAQ